MGNEERKARIRASTRSLVVPCVIAIVLLGALGVTGYVRIHDLTRINQANGALLNVSGRQRTLLLETALFADQMAHADTGEARRRIRERLEGRLAVLEASHARLLAGDEGEEALGALPDAARAVFLGPPYHVDRNLQSYVALVGALLELPSRELTPHHELVHEVVETATQGPLPKGMEEIVYRLQVESDERIATLMATEDWALGLSFVALLATGLLVFAPMVRKVRQHMISLTDLNATLEERVASRTARFKSSERRIRAVLNSVVEGIITIDEKGTIENLNPAAKRIFGYRGDEMRGQNVRMLMPEPYHGEHDGYLERYRRTGEARIIGAGREVEGRRKDGSVFPMELAVSEVRSVRRRRFVGTLRDITERRQTEEALRQAKEAAESANRTKSEFLANMSHEIRTPMNGILGMTELTLDTELSDEQRGYLRAVKQSADALLRIINDILDFSKIEAGKLELEEAGFSLRDEIGNTLKTLATRAHQKGLELAWDVAGDVPDALEGDTVRLRQVLVNLVGNAIKFTERGEVVVRVRLDAETDVQVRLQFSVSDTGIGIAEKAKSSIFDAFAQADASTTRRYGGTGLGLAISSQLVRMMGGTIVLESAPQQGSTFRFDAIFKRADPNDTAGAAAPQALFDLPVLVVDDNDTNRRILAAMLANWGMQPTVVAGGPAALEALRDASAAGRPFPLVLLDYHMPDMDGLMVAAQIRKDATHEKTSLLLLTSGARASRQTRVEELGIGAQLTKPVTQSELLDAVLRNVREVETTQTRAAPEFTDPLDGRKLRVLVAEDNVVNQRLAVRLLEKHGHEVEVARTGREALDVLQGDGRFDAVLMDVQMPEMDGYEATAALREKEEQSGGHLPIVAMTAHAMEGDRERCLEAGMDEYVSKPIAPQRLFGALAAALGRGSPTDG